MDNKNIYIVKKIDNYQIVINKGTQNEINSFMRFLVYEEGEEIIDPNTKQSLGKLEIPKGFFKVQHIQEKMTTLISELKKDKRIIPVLDVFGEIDAEKDLLNSIKVGDRVKIINEL
ncbi:hypothetical protein [Flavobacterium sp. I3-2]|uniref:hypothetical protein n=1 Tax=Flavobacterium sp. I3-2 TaxID=2748319 RepID=UPI0015B138AA|nr:hypothetical protein [Flavobacterium sp. I3-2]